jgi:hypothetical protein
VRLWQFSPLLENNAKEIVFFRIECPRPDDRGLHPFLHTGRNQFERFNNFRCASSHELGCGEVGSCIPDRLCGGKRIQSDVGTAGIVI